MTGFAYCDACEYSFGEMYVSCIYCNAKLRRVESSEIPAGTAIVETEEVWTCEAVLESMFKDLMRSEQIVYCSGRKVLAKRYLHKARLIQERIGLYKPLYFDIKESDLSPTTKDQLSKLSRQGLAYVLRTTLYRIYEFIDPEEAPNLRLQSLRCRVIEG